jgi:hypothetical protein
VSKVLPNGKLKRPAVPIPNGSRVDSGSSYSFKSKQDKHVITQKTTKRWGESNFIQFI